MLKDVGLEWVILGHSERRNVFAESNQVSIFCKVKMTELRVRETALTSFSHYKICYVRQYVVLFLHKKSSKIASIFFIRMQSIPDINQFVVYAKGAARNY